MAGGANVAQTAFAVAARAGEAELHGTRHLCHVSGPIALRTNGRRATGGAGAVACFTYFLARDVETHLRAADGLPKVDIQPVFEIGAFFRAHTRLLTALVSEEL